MKTLLEATVAIGIFANLASVAIANNQPPPRSVVPSRPTHQVVCAAAVAAPTHLKVQFVGQPAGWEGGWQMTMGTFYYNLKSITAGLQLNYVECDYESGFFLKLKLRAGESCTVNSDRKSATCT